MAVDDWVPGEGKVPSFAKPTADHDLWGVILEKAWAKIHGNYMITQAGWVILLLMNYTKIYLKIAH